MTIGRVYYNEATPQSGDSVPPYGNHQWEHSSRQRRHHESQHKAFDEYYDDLYNSTMMNCTGTTDDGIACPEKVTSGPSTAFIGSIWIFLIVAYCCMKPRRDEQAVAEAQRQLAELRRQRRLKNKKVDPVERKKKINLAIVTKKVASCRGDTDAPMLTLADISEGGDGATMAETETVVPDSSSSGDDDSPCSTCSICLEPFEVGDEVSWSRRMACRHVFHEECVQEWLMRHDDCPCCRSRYIPKSKGDDLEEGEEGAESTDEEEEEVIPEPLGGGSGVFYIMHGLISEARRRYSLVSRSESNFGDEGNNNTNEESVAAAAAAVAAAVPDLVVDLENVPSTFFVIDDDENDDEKDTSPKEGEVDSPVARTLPRRGRGNRRRHSRRLYGQLSMVDMAAAEDDDVEDATSVTRSNSLAEGIHVV